MSVPETSAEIYRAIERDGRAELARPLASVFWSGVAAGIAISLSVFCEAFLHRHLPEATWRPVVASLGYSVGFVVVILGRLQLFTEETLTVVLPTVRERTFSALGVMLRMWAIVFLANMLGTMFAAGATVFGGLQTGEIGEAVLSVSRHFARKDGAEAFLHGIPAGFLVATLVWILPRAGSVGFFAIILMTYMIALGDFSHVVAGSTEVWLLLFEGEIGPSRAVGGLILPTLAGNVVGGTGLVALLAYEQVRGELDGDPTHPDNAHARMADPRTDHSADRPTVHNERTAS